MFDLKWDQTGRGFLIARFRDRYGVECSLQESSLATERACWLGPSAPNPTVTIPGVGVAPLTLPPEASCTTRAHLTREMALAVGEALVRFATTGELGP